MAEKHLGFDAIIKNKIVIGSANFGHKYGFNNSKNSIGINATAVPINTIEIFTMIGVTLFFENVLIIKQREVTVNIKMIDSQKLKPNRQNVSEASKTKSPS